MTQVAHDASVQKHSSLRQTLVPILAFLGTLIVLFPNNPGNMTLPSRDSGVFLYVGWRLLKGDVPYRDVWDHKPPLIYFIDALGLALTPNSLWGVWLLQFVFIFLTLLLIYKSLLSQFDTLAAITGTVTLTSGLLTLLENGNVTEEYALVFQAAGIWLFLKAWKHDLPTSTSFWIGLCGGLAFNSKQTTIGLWIVYGIMLIIMRLRQRRLPLVDLFWLFTGWLVPSLIFGIYLGSHNALSDFWQQAYAYNFSYVGKHEGIRRLVPVFVKGFFLLSNGWVLYLVIAAWLAGAGYLWLARKDIFGPERSLILIGLLGLPIEVLLVMVSGRSIIHYYLTPMPVIAILVGTATYTAPFLLARIPRFASTSLQRWISSAVFAIVLIGQTGQIRYYPDYIRIMQENEHAAVMEFVSKNTQEGDKVLIIGAESAINFLTRREAPTRYVYQYPLALTGSRPMFEEYFSQILQDEPTLIIDTRGRAKLTEKLYVPLQKRSEIVRLGVEYLGVHYEPVAQFGEWIVYRRIDSP